MPIHSLILGQPQISRIVIYYIILALSLLWINKRTIIKLYPLLIWTAAVILLLFPIPRKYFKAVFLDVGQGDGILLQHTDGTTFLIDGGSTSKNNIGEYCLIPYLKSQGIHCIDYMIMTHADKDHISGQLELMKHVADRQDIQIRKLLLPLPSQEMQSEEGYFLRFPLEEVTRKKKGAIGIRGMKLQEQDHVKHIYLTGVEEEDTPSIIYKEKELVFSKIRLMGRDGKGVKVRR